MVLLLLINHFLLLLPLFVGFNAWSLFCNAVLSSYAITYLAEYREPVALITLIVTVSSFFVAILGPRTFQIGKTSLLEQ